MVSWASSEFLDGVEDKVGPRRGRTRGWVVLLCARPRVMGVCVVALRPVIEGERVSGRTDSVYVYVCWLLSLL